MQHLRVDHDPQRELLQVRELRHDERLRLASFPGRPKESGLGAGQGIGAFHLVASAFRRKGRTAKGTKESPPRALCVLRGVKDHRDERRRRNLDRTDALAFFRPCRGCTDRLDVRGHSC